MSSSFATLPSLTLHHSINILIVANQEFSRMGLKLAILENSNHRVIGLVETVHDAQNIMDITCPEILLINHNQSDNTFFEELQALKTKFSDIRIIVIDTIEDEASMMQALQHGADAYCLSDMSTATLLSVMAMIIHGASWVDPRLEVAKKRFQSGERYSMKNVLPLNDAFTTLTKRELDVLELIVQGKSNKEIANFLTITTNTTKIHVSNIIQKMGVDDRTQVAIKALQQGNDAPFKNVATGYSRSGTLVS